ncbi:MAG: caspase family protein [Deltaproteobacteria bacterium]|nr:caspase family protein [Deltaproteobacteria bacterium]
MRHYSAVTLLGLFLISISAQAQNGNVAANADGPNTPMAATSGYGGEDVQFFALLVGSNMPGENQAPLQYAHRDMQKMREVLVEIGRHSPSRIHQLVDPGAGTLEAALNQIRMQIEGLPASAETRFVFYYSGHAKANALMLGNQLFSLKALRKALLGIPSSQKIVILDACQSGSFSRIKGIGVTADFSHNSRAALQTRGTAVLASSTSEELSQESDELEGSVFTHNLVTGLRGAADSDANGRVSLFEAYDYAYNNTLVATADTRVGQQHVTLETDMKGTGETVLTWPAKASARLLLPAEIQGKVVIFDETSHAIHAEIQKSKGSDITLAFSPGRYGVLVSHQQRTLHCPVHLAKDSVTRLKKGSCQTSQLKMGTAKSGEKRKSDGYRWAPFVELQFGLMYLRKDDYIRRLEDSGYNSDIFGWRLPNGERFDFGIQRIRYGELLFGMWLNRYVAMSVLYSNLDKMDFWRHAAGHTITEERTYGIDGKRLCAQGRVQYGFFNDRLKPHVLLDVGLAWVNDRYSYSREESGEDWTAYPNSFETNTAKHFGPAFGLGIGLTVRVFKWLQLVAQWKYVYAPVLKNAYDERQDAGGWIVSTGLHLGK